jgi:hypothetical protein
MTVITRSKWFLPAFALAMGVGIWAAYWVGGDFELGATSFGMMSAVALLFLAGGRSETVRGLRGDGRDERFAQIDQRATAFAGVAVLLAIIVGWLVDVAHGRDGEPYVWLGALGGIAYVVAVAVARLRG